MKHIRRLTALLLCLLLTGAASSALAAPSKTFTTVPTLKISVPKKGVGSYGYAEFTFTCSVPGFLTVNLLSPTGEIIETFYDNEEVHSKANDCEFYAMDENEDPMAPGDYTIVGTLVNQFGVASKETTATLKITEISADDLTAYQEALAQRLLEEQEQAMMAGGVSSAVSSAASSFASSSASSAFSSLAASSALSSLNASAIQAPAAMSSDDVVYTAGVTSIGDEGLQIGVGVSDVAQQNDAGYWGLTASSSDAEIWAALTRTMVSVDVDEQESAYIYNSVSEGRKKLGAVSGLSQGLNLVTERADGWSLVEAYRKEDGAFIRGYIRSNKLRTVEPNGTYGIVIDKSTQTLIVYKDGVRLGSCPVSTGLATPKYLHRETPAGEYIIVTRRGTTEYYGQGYSKYTMRISGSYYLSEIPTTKKNGSDYSILEPYVGQKATRGNICIARNPSMDGGINAEWIWNMTDLNRKAKVLIFDDKPRSDVPVGE